MNTTNQNEILDPILLLVKPEKRKQVNLEQVKYILRLKKENPPVTNREIAKRYYAETGIDLSTERIGQISRRYKGGLKYV